MDIRELLKRIRSWLHGKMTALPGAGTKFTIVTRV